tara:strand:+ start:481 stop:1197 length:717 start_codon:yes stop_codon:yes gene_type:complete
MKSNYSFEFTSGVIGYPILFVLLIWIAFWAELRFGLNLKTYGIYPRELNGLIGVFTSVFIHGSLSHLYNNTIPLFVLAICLFYFYRPVAWKVTIFGIVLSGFITWIIGKSAFHIGSSSLVYVFMSFLLFKGLISRHYRLIALSFIIVFLYGGMIWYIFPIKAKMSWEGHLSGFITGLVFAFLYKTKPLVETYSWEEEEYDKTEDPFMKHFDPNGNFIEFPNSEDNNDIKVNYKFKSDD